MTTVELDIDGMTCAGCASRVEKALIAVRGVDRAQVNLALERAQVEGDAGADALIASVERAGYAAWRHDDTDEEVREARARAEARQGWLWFAAAALLTLPFLVQMVAMALGLDWMMPYWLEPILAAPVVFGAGLRFYKGAFHAILTRTGTMDLLVALGTGAAFFYSLALVLMRGPAAEGHLYFEAAAVIVTLVLLGKRLEARAKRGTAEAVRGLMALRPETARRETAAGEETVSVAVLAIGDILRVLPGEQVPVDGRVLEGVSEADESLITGESVPVPKAAGDPVVGGALNGAGLLRIEATAVGKDSTLSKIARLVERAQAGKAPVQKLVDRVSAIFVPVVLGIAVVTFAGWLIAGQSVEAALIAAVSVLVIACPCALGLASPTAIVAGTGAAARAGILIKDVEAMERAAKIDTILFDKTGTLTEGKPRLVSRGSAEGSSEDDALALAAALQRGSTHPLAAAFRDAAGDKGGPKIEDFRNRPGEGLTGRTDGVPVALGNRALMARVGAALSDVLEAAAAEREAAGETTVFLARDRQVIAWFGLADTPRAGAPETLDALRKAGLRVEMLSGDSKAVAERIGRDLNFDVVTAEVTPDRKATLLRARQAEGRRVAMVGDGINDAPALVQADLGIAMGGGADVALDAAPVTLMRPDPGLVPGALAVCRKTVWKIRQNLFWAFIYNVIGLPLAAFGYLSPAVAGAAMALSSVSVVTSSLMLRRWKP